MRGRGVRRPCGNGHSHLHRLGVCRVRARRVLPAGARSAGLHVAAHWPGARRAGDGAVDPYSRAGRDTSNLIHHCDRGGCNTSLCATPSVWRRLVRSHPLAAKCFTTIGAGLQSTRISRSKCVRCPTSGRRPDLLVVVAVAMSCLAAPVVHNHGSVGSVGSGAGVAVPDGDGNVPRRLRTSVRWTTRWPSAPL